MWENVARRALHNGTKRRPHITCITHQNSKHERHRLTGFTRGSQRTNSCFPTVLDIQKSVNQRTHTTSSSTLREKQRITCQNFLHPVHRRSGKDASYNDEANRTHMLRMRHAARHAENRQPRCATRMFFFLCPTVEGRIEACLHSLVCYCFLPVVRTWHWKTGLKLLPSNEKMVKATPETDFGCCGKGSDSTTTTLRK